MLILRSAFDVVRNDILAEKVVGRGKGATSPPLPKDVNSSGSTLGSQ
jgi:hypothetical protein